MAEVVDQNIPGGLFNLYKGTLSEAKSYVGGAACGKRIPFRRWMLKGNGLIYPDVHMGYYVTWPMFYQRRHFARAVYYWEEQLYGSGATPPDWGPRSRGYWFAAAAGTGLWYYNYYIQQTINTMLAGNVPDWCKTLFAADATVQSLYPDNNFGMDVWSMICNVAPPWGPFGICWHYIKTAFPGGYIWISIYVFSGHFPTPNTIVLGVYETSPTWDEATITWNNKPACGNLIMTLTFPYVSQVHYAFKLPKKPDGVSDYETFILKLHSPNGALLLHTIQATTDVQWRPFHYAFPKEG